MNDVKLLIVQPLKKLLGIGNTPHESYSASVMECGASMNLERSIGICRPSLPTNWHLTFSAKYRALKLAPSRGRVIFEAMRATGSKLKMARRGWLAYEAQFTYKGTGLEKEYFERNA